jgi:hypothetical protein
MRDDVQEAKRVVRPPSVSPGRRLRPVMKNTAGIFVPGSPEIVYRRFQLPLLLCACRWGSGLELLIYFHWRFSSDLLCLTHPDAESQAKVVPKFVKSFLVADG